MKMQFTYEALIPTGVTYTKIKDNIVLELPNNADTTEEAKRHLAQYFSENNINVIANKLIDKN